MTGCPDCDEWVTALAAGAPPGAPAARDCPRCGRTVVAFDIRPSTTEEPMTRQRTYAYGPDGRVGEVMGPRQIGSPITMLRPPGGGIEWEVHEDDLVHCHADGSPAPAPEPAP